jgi:hypothetical protein
MAFDSFYFYFTFIFQIEFISLPSHQHFDSAISIQFVTSLITFTTIVIQVAQLGSMLTVFASKLILIMIAINAQSLSICVHFYFALFFLSFFLLLNTTTSREQMKFFSWESEKEWENCVYVFECMVHICLCSFCFLNEK